MYLISDSLNNGKKFLKHLTHVINISLHGGIMSELYKIYIYIIYIYKLYDEGDSGNYMPISLVSTMGHFYFS